MRRIKVVVALVLVLVVLAIGGGVLWWVSVPHSAEEQFAFAEKLEKQVRVEVVTKGIKEAGPALERTVGEYRKVESKWGKSAKAAEGLMRAAKLREEVGKDDAKAIEILDKVARDYTGEADAGQALLDLARLMRRQADALKIARGAEAVELYKKALERLEEYRKRFAAGKQADGALMEIGRIWQDGIGDPLINAIQTFEKFLKDYPTSVFYPEALYRLASLLEFANETERALAIYTELSEKYPKSPWADKALFNKAKLLAEKMDKQKEAAEAFEKLQREHPNSELSGQAGAGAKSARQKQAREQAEDYSKKRYGGRMPSDTLNDKALPPAVMFREFAAQKLDAQKYDLDVAFAPGENRITVKGTLAFVNRGEDKKELLFQLASRMSIRSASLDGVAVKGDLNGETWKLSLPTVLKKDAAATLAFEYSGTFEAPMTEDPEELQKEAKEREAREAGGPPKAGGGKEEGKTGTATMPAGEKGAEGAATQGATRPARRIYRGNPQIGLGEYGYGLAGAPWYPVTIIGDIFEAKMAFKAPAGSEVVANGALLSRGGGEAVFETKRPVFGLYFAYGKYVVREFDIGKVHFYTYLKEGHAGKAEELARTAGSVLEFYADRFGAFPYEKMAIVEAPLPPFLGGVGPASLMILQEAVVAQHDVPSTLLAHELAHQWFGNLVPINLMDPGYNQWLSEGFATYADALYTEKMEGKEALARHMQRYGQLYFQMSLHFKMQSVKDCLPGSAVYRPVIYEKGAIVLHALRKVMGDEKFFELMKRFVGTYQDKPCVVNDFRRMANDVAGKDLSWFFAEWLDQTVYARWKMDAPRIAGSGPCKVSLKVRQPEDMLKMPVDVTLLGAGGERHVAENVMIEQYEQDLELSSPFVPVKIILDESNWILKHPGQDNIWPMEKPAAEK